MRSSSAPTPRPAGKFRSLLVGVNRGDSFVYVGRVGTGYGAKVKEFCRS
jgi:ATP-dependent DNA ligase